MSILFWIMVLLCLVKSFAKPINEDVVEEEACGNACIAYSRWGYDCALRAGCFENLEMDTGVEGFDVCYGYCMMGAFICHEMCIQNYDAIEGRCQQKCENASFFNIFCDSNCFEEEFEGEFQKQLPDLTPQDVGIWKGIPILDDEGNSDVDFEDLED